MALGLTGERRLHLPAAGDRGDRRPDHLHAADAGAGADALHDGGGHQGAVPGRRRAARGAGPRGRRCGRPAAATAVPAAAADGRPPRSAADRSHGRRHSDGRAEPATPAPHPARRSRDGTDQFEVLRLPARAAVAAAADRQRVRRAIRRRSPRPWRGRTPVVGGQVTFRYVASPLSVLTGTEISAISSSPSWWSSAPTGSSCWRCSPALTGSGVWGALVLGRRHRRSSRCCCRSPAPSPTGSTAKSLMVANLAALAGVCCCSSSAAPPAGLARPRSWSAVAKAFYSPAAQAALPNVVDPADLAAGTRSPARPGAR